VDKSLIDVTGAVHALRQFAQEREWQQFHSPKNLVMALSGEVGELTEIFQWMTEADSHSAASNPKTASAVRDELADVALYLIRLADVLDVDLNAAIASKLSRRRAASAPNTTSCPSHDRLSGREDTIPARLRRTRY
jgi:dCTP diphosphatase